MNKVWYKLVFIFFNFSITTVKDQANHCLYFKTDNIDNLINIIRKSKKNWGGWVHLFYWSDQV